MPVEGAPPLVPSLTVNFQGLETFPREDFSNYTQLDFSYNELTTITVNDLSTVTHVTVTGAFQHDGFMPWNAFHITGPLWRIHRWAVVSLTKDQ